MGGRWRGLGGKGDVSCLSAGNEVFSIRGCSVRSKPNVEAVMFLGKYILQYG